LGRDRPTPTAAHGLHLLDGQHGVLLVGVEHHQDLLRRCAPDAPAALVQVVVELRFVPSPDGARVVEARIRGDRVGLLPEPDATRYRPLLERAEQLGVRPGCDGHVRGAESGGLDVEVFLPAFVDPDMLGSDEPEPISWLPPAPVEARRTRRSLVLLGLTAAALLLAVVGVVGYGRWSQPVDPSAGPAALSPSGVAQPPPASASPVPPAPVPLAPAPTFAPTTTRLPITNGGCDPNYSGACVPIASRVECAGPGSSGPVVVRGPFRVTGTDLYQLDPDGDGIACGPVRPVATIPQVPARSELSESASASPTTSSTPDDDSSDDGN
jgi:hypothetical protein